MAHVVVVRDRAQALTTFADHPRSEREHRSLGGVARTDRVPQDAATVAGKRHFRKINVERKCVADGPPRLRGCAMEQSQEPILRRLAKVLRPHVDDIAKEPLPTRWVELIRHLDNQERKRWDARDGGWKLA